MLTGNTETRISVTYEDGDGTIDFAVDDMTANTQLTQEQVEDYAGALVASGGTKTGITVTYQDGTGDMDFAVSDLTVTGDSGSTGMTPGDTLTIAGGTACATSMSGDTLTINATDTNTQLTQEQVEDYAGALVASGGTKTGISVTYQDGTGDMDFAVSDLTVTGDSGSTGMTPGDTLTIAGGTACATSMSGDTLTINATDTNTTYSAGNGLSLSTTTFSVAGGNGLVQESSGLALDDPANLDELTESNDATDDKIFLWDEDASTWKYMTLDNLQDSIDTGGGGSGASLSGTTNNTVATVTGANALIGEANLTFDGNSLLVVTGSASAVPCTIKGASSQSVDLLQCQDNSGDNLLMIDQGGSIRLGLGGDREVHVEPESGTNRAGKDLFLKGGKSTGNGEGGDVRIYTSPVGSSGVSVNGWSEALKIRHDKVVDFKIAGGAKTVTLQNNAMDEYMSGTATVTVNATEWLEIKVAGNTRYIPVWS